jgi:hypothetical protein
MVLAQSGIGEGHTGAATLHQLFRRDTPGGISPQTHVMQTGHRCGVVSLPQPTYKRPLGRLMEQDKPSVRLLSFFTGVIAGTLAAIGRG